jgi:hypothetical protein
MDLETIVICQTCQDTGEVDETLGGISTSDRMHAPCPDCVAPVPIYIYVPPKAQPPCICKPFGRLRLVNLKCNAHSAGDSNGDGKHG